jgi:phage N-6-adenine-methyltransferase
MKIWSTPQRIFDKLNDEFCFDMDVCADADNAKCIMFYSRQRGLTEPWGGVVFLNPPYGRGLIQPWIQKAYEVAARREATAVCLIPSRTNPPWWHDFVMKATEIRFIRSKVSFLGIGENTTPFWGNSIVVFRKGMVGQTPKVSSWDQPQRGPTTQGEPEGESK